MCYSATLSVGMNRDAKKIIVGSAASCRYRDKSPFGDHGRSKVKSVKKNECGREQALKMKIKQK
jgi:hypothetical protein